MAFEVKKRDRLETGRVPVLSLSTALAPPSSVPFFYLLLPRGARNLGSIRAVIDDGSANPALLRPTGKGTLTKKA
jgi:hypothetical protein